MTYPDILKLRTLVEQIHLFSQLKQEYGAAGLQPVLEQAEQALQAALVELKDMQGDPALAAREPDDLADIRALRPNGPRRIWNWLDEAVYCEKLAGALLGRMAGCILGAAVEGWPLSRMEELAQENGDPFPPTNYWKYIPHPLDLHYGVSPNEAYTRTKMDGVPVDDDITYTLLGLFILEEFGPGFTTQDVGKAWLKYLPMAYTAEEIALKNLKSGIPPAEAGVLDNPFTEWIGADIRADPWGYLAPGWPEKAAEMAYRDARISHRRTGVYGAMFFAAAVAAAFVVDDPLEAVRIGLSEIPAECRLAQHIRWALMETPNITDYRQAHQAVARRFPGMSGAHTINNACLTVFGLALGKTDFSRVIGETVAMGMDNDCTAATAGSLCGAVIGQAAIPATWYQDFNDTILTYMIGVPWLSIPDVIERFTTQARRVMR